MWREVDASVFFALPLPARVRHVLDGTVQFVRDGEEVESHRYLRERQRQSTPGAPRPPRRPTGG